MFSSHTINAIQVIATGVSTWLVDRAGRRLLLIVSLSTSQVIINLEEKWMVFL